MRAEARHSLKHDKFAETLAGTAADTYSWATEHRKNLIIGAVAAIIVLGGAIGGWVWNQQQQDKANAALGHATHVYETQLRPAGTPPMPGIDTFSSAAERAQAARREFSDIAAKYPHTSAGHLAEYMVGITYKDEGNYNDAEKALKRVADTGNRDVSNLAKYALANIYEATNRNADAVRVFKELVDHPSNTVAKSSAQLELAELYENTQQPAEAAKLYDQIKKDDPKSPEAQFADQKLAALKAK